MSEHDEQVAVCNYLDWLKLPYFAIPNGMWVPGLTGIRLAKYINKMKAEGMKKGVPDLFICKPIGSHSGLFIELKTKTGRLSTEQKEWLKTLSTAGYRAICCKGSAEAIKEIDNYLKGE